MYTITYQVDSYVLFQWAECPLFHNFSNSGDLKNEKVARLASSDTYWEVINLHINIYIFMTTFASNRTEYKFHKRREKICTQ